MRNMFILAYNTLKIAFRKKVNILTTLVFPVVSLLIIVTLESGGSTKLNIGICNNDINGKISNDFITSLKNESKYNIILVKSDEIEKKVTEQKVDCVLTIPEDFDDKILSGNFDKLQITAIRGADATGWIQSYVDYYIRNLMDISKAASGNIETFYKIYNGEKHLKINTVTLTDEHKGKSVSEEGIGLITLFMLLGASTVTGFMLKEKRERTYFRIFAAPVSSKAYIGGNLLAGMFIMIVQASVVVLALSKLLKIDTKVPDLQLFTLLTIFGLVSIGIGTLIVAFSGSSLQSSYLTILMTVPTSMLSGCFWPISLMPDFMQKLAYFFPQCWLLEGIRRIQNTGTFSSSLPCIGILLGFSLIFFLVSAFKVRSNSSVKSFV